MRKKGNEMFDKLEKATMEVMSRGISREELGGFVKESRPAPRISPFVQVKLPSKAEGRKGYEVVVGVKGRF